MLGEAGGQLKGPLIQGNARQGTRRRKGQGSFGICGRGQQPSVLPSLPAAAPHILSAGPLPPALRPSPPAPPRNPYPTPYPAPPNPALPDAPPCRLPFFLHCLVDGLIVWSSLLGLPAKCLAQGAHAPQPLREAFFVEALQQVQGLISSIPLMPWAPQDAQAKLCALPAGGVTPAAAVGAFAAPGSLPGPAPLGSPSGLDGSCCCAVVVGLVTVVLGYVVPCSIVALAEVQARAHYMAVHMGEEGWEQKDILDHLMSSCTGSTVRFLCLLPAMVTLSWHLVVWAVAPLPAGGAPGG